MVSLNGSGINGILNTASGSKMKITSVPIEDIVRNEQNEYSMKGSTVWQHRSMMSDCVSPSRSSGCRTGLTSSSAANAV